MRSYRGFVLNQSVGLVSNRGLLAHSIKARNGKSALTTPRAAIVRVALSKPFFDSFFCGREQDSPVMPQKGVAPAHLQKKRRGKKTNLGRVRKGTTKDKKRAAAATKNKISQKGKRKACDTIEPSHDSPKKLRRAAAEQAETKRREQMADASKGCECDAIGERAMRCAIAVHFSRILDFPDRGKWAGKGGAIREIMTHFRIPDGSYKSVEKVHVGATEKGIGQDERAIWRGSHRHPGPRPIKRKFSRVPP